MLARAREFVELSAMPFSYSHGQVTKDVAINKDGHTVRVFRLAYESRRQVPVMPMTPRSRGSSRLTQ